ncbi:Nickel/cobalt efflux system [Georgfuchsia toluolica]|uniref:Nickel/cobalt efflux system n=1 Tax=Georgfuchsia toluolica TaxID=424218 RepID=A0A916J5B6_9PROT|nr:nickel transporter [Georgfuchsia toluolica]CAG4883470.1 Nickel/cobalt efflux system [Georgfuchsia toluolica]
MDASLPQEWSALCVLVFVLGLKHGFDADHLATIDSLTRFNSRTRPCLARRCGMLFSLGHGFVMIVIALLVGTLAQHWLVPAWLTAFGAWVSVVFLLSIGVVNVHAVLRAEPGEVVRAVGLKGRFLGRLAEAASPFWVALVGALFALSFDTVSQAALFALTATRFGGWQHPLALGLLFMLGMLVTDGANGIWISRLILRADRIAALASRVMSLAVAGISLLVGTFGVMKLSLPAVAAWSERRESYFGIAVVSVVAFSFLLAVRMSRGRSVKIG